MQSDTLIRQFMKKAPKDLSFEYYEYVFSIISNLIDTDLPKNKKFMFVNELMFERCIVAFNDDEGNFEIGNYSRALTRDRNLLPEEISIRTLNGDLFNRRVGDYVMMYNPIPVRYLGLKIEEMAKIEDITNYRRKLYKSPIVFKGSNASALESIKRFIANIFFNTDDVCTVVNKGTFNSDDLEKIDLNIEYITDKLLDESESIKEDILEILGIYKNTSGNRERVNETELIIANSNTSISKLGLEDSLKNFFSEISETLGHDYKFSLNIDKIFEMKGEDNNV